MSFQCPNVAEVIPVVMNGVIQAQSIAQFSSQFSGQFKTPTTDFSAIMNGHTLSFKKNVPFIVNAAMLAFLTSQSAPII